MTEQRDGCPKCGDPDYLGYEVLGVYDGVLYWVCSQCGHAWARFTGEDRLSEASKRYAAQHNHESEKKV